MAHPKATTSSEQFDEWEGQGGSDDQAGDDAYWVNDDVDDAEEYEDEGEFGPGVTVVYSKPDEQREVVRIVSDLPDEAYSDPLSLVNCWEEALYELKASHAERFLPPRESPRSLSQRQAKAPFWHGPSSTVPVPAPVASTSKSPYVPPASSSKPSARASTLIPSTSMTASAYVSDEPAPKKRKRLTGSQKKARKLAKLEQASGCSDSGSAQTTRDGRASGRLDRGRVDDDDDEDDGPTYQPESPNFDPESLPEETDSGPPLQRPARDPAAAVIQRIVGPQQVDPPPPVATTTTVSPSHPEPEWPRPVGALPRSFPAPPPIMPLTGDENELEPESPENLLQAALWSWYTAGYQTALYHASVGVATFKAD
ncbi:hypothetical protein JCM10212_003490 [Sporobolomyces blumeae]